jgi:anti-anti-sigma factor
VKAGPPCRSARRTLRLVQVRSENSITRRRGYVVVAPTGELDIATTPALRGRLGLAISSGATPAVDLRAVTFMDSSGIHLLAWADRESLIRGRRLQLIAGDRPLRVLQVCDAGPCFSWMSPEQLGPA